MANPSKAKGTRAETSVVRFLRERGWEARRKALAGSNDVGDIECRAPGMDGWLSLEVKAGKQTANPSRSQIDEWLRQAMVEAENSGTDCYLVVVRYRRGLKDADVYSPNADGDRRFKRGHAFLDEFADR